MIANLLFVFFAVAAHAADPAPSPLESIRDSRWGVVASVGFPHALTVGVSAIHPSKMFSAELNAGTFGTGVGGLGVRMTNTEAIARYHPWAGALHAGIKLGHRVLTAGKSKSIFTGPVNAEATVRSDYIAPHIGWLWIAESGFMLGFDVGWSFPFAVSSDFESNAGAAALSTADYRALRDEVSDWGRTLGETGLPTMTLLKTGWSF